MSDEAENQVDEQDSEQLEDGAEEKPVKSKKKLLIILSVSIFAVLLCVVAGLLVLTSGEDEVPQVAEETTKEETESNKENGEETTAKQEEDTSPASPVAKESSGPKTKALFFTIRPPFVVNFQGSSRAKYLQLSVDIMARQEAVISAVEDNLPLIKNDLIALFSSQTYEELKTPEGREALRKAAVQTVQAVLVREAGQAGVEDVLFTTFVMQ